MIKFFLLFCFNKTLHINKSQKFKILRLYKKNKISLHPKMNELETIQELILDKERNQQKWNLEQDHKNKELRRVNGVIICKNF